MNFNTPKIRSISAAGAALAAVFAVTTAQSASAGLTEAARDTKPAFNVRYRLETVDQTGIENTASASTARARLSWIMPSTDGFSVGLEGDYVFLVGAERYNSTNNGLTEYPVVADPTGFDLNRAFARYRNDGLTVTAGRQWIGHGPQYFVAPKAWRQNEQTYDAVRVQSTHGNMNLDYTYVVNVNRIFGKNGAQPTDWEANTHLLRGEFTPLEGHVFSAFAYLMDFENDNGPANSNRTFGIDYTASLGAFGLFVSAARQSEWADNPRSFDVGHFVLEGQMKQGPVAFTAGYEIIGSDDGRATVLMPIAAQHKFRGWADKFVSTPLTGLRNAYLKAATNVGSFGLAMALYDFRAAEGGADYGREIDIAVTYPLGKRIGAQFKIGRYLADQHATDTTKAWLVVTYRL